MDDKNKKALDEIMKRQHPDYSHVKRPVKHSVKAMVENLHAAAKLL